MAQPEIVMYMRPHCLDVTRTQTALRRRGLTWREVDIEQDEEACRQVQEWTGRAATPTLWIGRTVLVEPDEAAIDEAIQKETQ